MGGRSRGRWGAMLAVLVAAGSLASGGGVPSLGASEATGTPPAPPVSARAGWTLGESRCPPIDAIDPGFDPAAPDSPLHEPDRIDPGFAPLPEPLPGEWAGERLDPGFVARFPPCPPPGTTPSPGDSPDGG